MHAIILAGGKGTRLRPLTDHVPKPLLPFMGEPYAVGLLRRLAAAGCTRATFLVGQDPAAFAALVPAGAPLGIAVEAIGEEVPLDTAGAARRLLRDSDERAVLVCNGDVLTDLDYSGLRREHDRTGAVATLALTVVEDTSSFGVVACEADGRVREFVEKPAPGTTPHRSINAGTYVIDARAFDAFPGAGPLSFERAVFPGLLAAGAVMTGVVSDAHWQDLGTPQRYLRGHEAVLADECAWPWAPSLRPVADGVAVDADAVVHPDAVLQPPVVVGPRSVVEAGARLCGAVLHADCRVDTGAVVEQAILGQGARVGARVSLPEGTVLTADGSAA